MQNDEVFSFDVELLYSPYGSGSAARRWEDEIRHHAFEMQPRRSRFRSMRDTILRTGVKELNIDGSVNDRWKELMRSYGL